MSTKKNFPTAPVLRISAARLMTLLAVGTMTVVVNARQPRLVLGIVVNGLRQEHIDMLRGSFGPDGFNRLLDKGLVFENVEYGPGLDPTAAAAVIMTGASPSVNGIGSQTVYDPEAKRLRSVYNDGKTLGNYTGETMSPGALRVTTVTDEARISGAGVTYAYAVAMQPEMAITLAGHSANAALWLDPTTGNWAGSTAYTEFPASVASRNRLRPLSTRVDTMQWTPASDNAVTALLPDHLTRYPFRHTFTGSKADRIDAFMASPKANTEVTDVATDLLVTLALGTHPDGTDVLNLGYSLVPYPYTKTAENRYELTDSYLKLDADLARLFKAVDSKVGAGNSLIYLAGTPPSNSRRRDDEKWNIPSGEFSTRKAISLLNLYLIAIHGNGEWAKAFSNNTFYLNSALASDRQVDMAQLRRETADFLKRMAGVATAFSVDEIIDGSAPVDNPQALRRNTVLENSGDVKVSLVPGWELVDDYNNPGVKTGKASTHVLTTAPLYMLIPEAEPAVITTKVDARAVAPTITSSLRIRAPNGAATVPLPQARTK